MKACSVLADLRQRGVTLEANGDCIKVDAPAGVVDEYARELLTENKSAIIEILGREQRQLAKASRKGLAIKCSREHGWPPLHDPTTGEWHEIRAAECPTWVVKAANSYRRKAGGEHH